MENFQKQYLVGCVSVNKTLEKHAFKKRTKTKNGQNLGMRRVQKLVGN